MWVSRPAGTRQDGAEERGVRPALHQGVPAGGQGGLLLPGDGLLSGGAQPERVSERGSLDTGTSFLW